MGSKTKLSFSHFHAEVPQKYSDFVLQAHKLLTQNGYKPKFLLMKHGLSALYNSPKTKGNALQFVIRDDALHMYLYIIFLIEHDGLLERLPPVIIKEFDEYRNCTSNCESKCTGKCTGFKQGNEYTINGKLYHKCSVGRRFFTVNDEIVTGILFVLQKSI
jgi:hypothetical protein